jgi:hypothetical protein
MHGGPDRYPDALISLQLDEFVISMSGYSTQEYYKFVTYWNLIAKHKKPWLNVFHMSPVVMLSGSMR